MVFPIMLLIGLLGICGQGSNIDAAENEKYKPIEDLTLEECTTDRCMVEALEECSPAQEDIDRNGTKIHAEIRGKAKDNSCIVYMRLDELNPDILPSEMKFLASGIEGADMVCALTNEEADQMLAGKAGPEVLDKCNGPLKEYIKLAIG